MHKISDDEFKKLSSDAQCVYGVFIQIKDFAPNLKLEMEFSVDGETGSIFDEENAVQLNKFKVAFENFKNHRVISSFEVKIMSDTKVVFPFTC